MLLEQRSNVNLAGIFACSIRSRRVSFRFRHGLARTAPSTRVLGSARGPFVRWLLALRLLRLLHSVRIILTDWGKWLVCLPGRGPCIQYQILLGAQMGLLPMALVRWVTGRFRCGLGGRRPTISLQQGWVGVGAVKRRRSEVLLLARSWHGLLLGPLGTLTRRSLELLVLLLVG